MFVKPLHHLLTTSLPTAPFASVIRIIADSPV